MAKVYVVVEDGYKGSEGSVPYLIGVFDKKEDAENIIKNSMRSDDPRFILEIDKNVEYPLKSGSEDRNPEYRPWFNNFPLGGYIE